MDLGTERSAVSGTSRERYVSSLALPPGCQDPKNLPMWRRGGLRTLAEAKSLCS